jgi:pimeloyl-ACP methyl ester carboxylesterase
VAGAVSTGTQVHNTGVTEARMKTVNSKDGTTIAFDEQGDGPALILVDGAMGTRSSGSKPELAKLLAQHFTVYSYDRRGRGTVGTPSDTRSSGRSKISTL